jgi:hypothetical protein
MRRFILSLAPVLLLACAAPRTTVQAHDESGSVRFSVEPSYAEVVVDGKSVGKARQFDGSSAVLKPGPGSHTIVLKADGFEDYESTVYLSDTEELVKVKLKGKP